MYKNHYVGIGQLREECERFTLFDFDLKKMKKEVEKNIKTNKQIE